MRTDSGPISTFNQLFSQSFDSSISSPLLLPVTYCLNNRIPALAPCYTSSRPAQTQEICSVGPETGDKMNTREAIADKGPQFVIRHTACGGGGGGVADTEAVELQTTTTYSTDKIRTCITCNLSVEQGRWRRRMSRSWGSTRNQSNLRNGLERDFQGKWMVPFKTGFEWFYRSWKWFVMEDHQGSYMGEKVNLLSQEAANWSSYVMDRGNII